MSDQNPTPILPEAPKTVLPEAPKTVLPEAPKTILPEAPKTVLPEAPKTVLPNAPKPVVAAPRVSPVASAPVAVQEESSNALSMAIDFAVAAVCVAFAVLIFIEM